MHRQPSRLNLVSPQTSPPEFIDLDTNNMDSLMDDYMHLRYNPLEFPELQTHDFQKNQRKFDLKRIVDGKSTILLFRHTCPNIPSSRGEIKTGDAIALSESRITDALPWEYLIQLYQAGKLAEKTADRETKLKIMNATTKIFYAGTSQKPFQQFTDIEDLPPPQTGGDGFLMLIYIDPRLRKQGLPKTILTETLNHHRQLGAEYTFGYGRLPHLSQISLLKNAYERNGQLTASQVNNYLLQNIEGERNDSGLKIHVNAGATIICGLPQSVGDLESLNSGFLGIYKLNNQNHTQLPNII